MTEGIKTTAEATAFVGALLLTAWLVMLAAPLVAGVYLGFWQCLVGLWVGRCVVSVLLYQSGVWAQIGAGDCNDPNRR